MAARFIADCMVGRLAKWLRAFGFDVLYHPFAEDGWIASRAREEERILLTRDTGMRYVHGVRTIFIESDDVEEQLRQVVTETPLALDPARSLTRCTVCNGALVMATRDEVWERVPPYVYLTQERYAVCPDCRRVYWMGTHVANMLARLSELRGRARPGRAE